ncbi:MAG: site-specific integrase [Solirubrobacterales bacterium]
MYLAREGKSVSKTFRREAEARSWRAEALAAAQRGGIRPARRDTRTLADALREFIEGMKAGTVRPRNRGRYKPNTSRSYERALVNHIEPSTLGRLKVADVRRADVQSLADELLASGLAPGTVSNVLNPIQALYRRLIDRDLFAYNPATRIDLPAQGTARAKRVASAAHAAELIAPLRDEEQPLWAAAFYAGLRRGELQALRVCDVELGASLIHVEFGWDQEEGAIEPKSEASRRTIPLLAVLRDHLDEHLLRTGRTGEELVFGRTAVDPFVPSSVDNHAQESWAAAELEPIRLHDARHTFASLLIDSGANAKAVQEFMGHSKIQTTFDTYGHLLPGSHDEVRQRMDAYLLDATAEPVEAPEDAAQVSDSGTDSGTAGPGAGTGSPR